MAAQAVEYFVLLTVAGTQPDEETEDHIVLFSWAFISKSRNQVLAKEQLYVQPNQAVAPGNLPGGIKPEAVSTAASLPVVIKQFQSAVSKLGNSFMLLCPSALPLRHFLHREAQNYPLQLDDYFYQYVDINTEFSRGFPDNQRPGTLEEMCTFLGIEIAQNSPKLGLAELKMVADITQKLIMQGHTFGNPERIVKWVDDSARADPSLVEEGNVVRLRGLPYQVGTKEVAYFLNGLDIILGGIVFSINSVGRRTGEAIVVLETPEHAELAIKRHKFYLDHRYVEVYESTPNDFLQFVGTQESTSVHDMNVAVVRMQGLPYRCNEVDIVDFFGTDAPVKEGKGGVLIIRYPDGRASGDALALFDNDRDLELALEKNNHSIGSRYVELFRSSLTEFNMVLSRSGSLDQQQHFIDLLGLNVGGGLHKEGVVRGSETNSLKLRGLPYSAKAEDVIDFFGEFGDDIAQEGVHMVLNAMDRPTGECYVQMKSVEAAAKVARRFHKKMMGRRYIEIFECTGDDVALALAKGKSGGYPEEGRGGGGYLAEGRGGGGYRGGGRYRGGGGRGDERGARQRYNSGEGVSVKAKGLPYSTTESELARFFDEYDVHERDCQILRNRNGYSTGIANITFSSQSLASQAVREKHGKYIGNRFVELSLPY